MPDRSATPPISKRKPTPIVKQPEPPEPEIPLEILAIHIKAVSDAIIALDDSRLKRRVILLLVRDRTNLSLSQIEQVFTAMAELSKVYLNG